MHTRRALTHKGTTKYIGKIDINDARLHIVTDKTRAKYIERPLDEAKTEEREEFKKTFAEIQAQVLPESEINAPHKEFRDLAKQMLANTRRWKCLRELTTSIMMDTDEPLVLEDKDDAKGPPLYTEQELSGAKTPSSTTIYVHRRIVGEEIHRTGTTRKGSSGVVLTDTYPQETKRQRLAIRHRPTCGQRTDKAGPILHATNT